MCIKRHVKTHPVVYYWTDARQHGILALAHFDKTRKQQFDEIHIVNKNEAKGLQISDAFPKQNELIWNRS